jgi:hypothetical protein
MVLAQPLKINQTKMMTKKFENLNAFIFIPPLFFYINNSTNSACSQSNGLAFIGYPHSARYSAQAFS